MNQPWEYNYTNCEDPCLTKSRSWPTSNLLHVLAWDITFLFMGFINQLITAGPHLIYIYIIINTFYIYIYIYLYGTVRLYGLISWDVYLDGKHNSVHNLFTWHMAKEFWVMHHEGLGSFMVCICCHKCGKCILPKYPTPKKTYLIWTTIEWWSFVLTGTSTNRRVTVDGETNYQSLSWHDYRITDKN